MCVHTFTSLEAWRLVRDGLMPRLTCQTMTSGGCPLNGHSPYNNSYHTVLSVQ